MNTLTTTVYIWPKADHLPSSSPYCLKVIFAMRYYNIPHQLKVCTTRIPSWARRGRLPVAIQGEQKIEDSSQILKAINTQTENKLYPSDPTLRTQTLLWEEWADESLSQFVPYYRWAIDSNFDRFAEQLFSKAPYFVRKLVVPKVRKDILRGMRNDTIPSAPEPERQILLQEHLDILENSLQRREYLVADYPTAADFAVYPGLQIALNAPLPEMILAIQSRPALMKWIERMNHGSKPAPR